MASLMISGCNKPTSEMERAKKAIQDAKRNSQGCSYDEIRNAEIAYDEGKEEMNNWSYKKARAKFEDSYRIALLALNKECPTAWTPPTGTTPVMYGLPTSHTVVSGECLWWIAEYKDIYDDPFQWPIIYDANRSEIKSTAHSHGFYSREQNWIFPGQELDLPRDVTTDEIIDARKRSGAPDPYEK
jgi:nucleoid-associated protein YgaU